MRMYKYAMSLLIIVINACLKINGLIFTMVNRYECVYRFMYIHTFI